MSMLSLSDPELLQSLCFINGEWVAADNNAATEVINPATGQIIGQVPEMGVAETSRAIGAAQIAFAEWQRCTVDERAGILRNWFELIIQHQQDLALIMTSEQGKPLAEALAEVASAASYVEWFAEEARRTYGETIPSPWQDKHILTVREPVGVCAAITPWNFPIAMITRKVAPALAAGCTMIVKPAPQTPLSALALAALAQRAGVPAGVFNVITGDAVAIGSVLTQSPVVRKLTFTGSTGVGRYLAAQCAPTLKKLSMELGGNAPFIVFEDADIDAAVAGALAAKYRNSGQTCVCPNRFIIHEAVYEEFAHKLGQAVAALKVGAGTDPEVLQGPLIDQVSLAKVEQLVADATGKGARVVTGGKRHSLGGTFFEPTLLADVTLDMRVSREEIFGPVAPLIRFRDEVEAVRIANATEFGLAGYFYSRDIGRAWRVSRALQFGMVAVNTGLITTAVAPFGGIKQSGYGREGSLHGIQDYMDIKYICMAE